MLADGSNKYVYGNGRVAQYAGASASYFLADGLGSGRQLADSTGNVTLAERYEPYGAPLARSGTGASVYGFAGQQREAAGLLFLRARYYGSETGTFITKDSVGR